MTPEAHQRRSRVSTRLSRPGSGRPIDSKVLRPMSTILPRVNALKRLRPAGSRHGSALSRPMTPFCAMATIREISGCATFMPHYCKDRAGSAIGRRVATVLDLDGRVENHHVAEGHAEELRGLRAVLLHAREQPPLQAAPARQRAGAHHVPADEERAVLGEYAQPAGAARLECLGDIWHLHEAEARGDAEHPGHALLDL